MSFFVVITKLGFLITNRDQRERGQLFGIYGSAQQAFDSVTLVASVIEWDVKN